MTTSPATAPPILTPVASPAPPARLLPRSASASAPPGGVAHLIAWFVIALFWVVGLSAWAARERLERPLPDPRPAALAVLTAHLRGDWNTVYSCVAFGRADHRKYRTADRFVRFMEARIGRDPAVQATFTLLATATDVQVGTAVIRRRHAEIPTAFTLHEQGYAVAYRGVARMVFQEGAWRLDLTDSPQAPGPRALFDLIGEPDPSQIPGGTAAPFPSGSASGWTR